MCGLDVPAAPTDDDVAEEEEEEVRINDEQSAEVCENLAAEEEVVRIAPDPGQPSHKQVEEHRTGGTSRTVPGADGATLAEEEANRTGNDPNQLSP